MITYKGYKINTIEKPLLNNPNQIKMFIDLKENLINQIETRFISVLWTGIENEKTINNNSFDSPFCQMIFLKI